MFIIYGLLGFLACMTAFILMGFHAHKEALAGKNKQKKHKCS